jgi:uncharacterized protein (TIGR02246 family)
MLWRVPSLPRDKAIVRKLLTFATLGLGMLVSACGKDADALGRWQELTDGRVIIVEGFEAIAIFRQSKSSGRSRAANLRGRTIMRFFWLLVLLLAATACGRSSSFDPAAEEAQIRRVIADMEAAWNRGDFRGYMAGFKNPDVVFVSRGEIQRDWQGTLDHYVRDYGGAPERRGQLHFSDIRIEMLSPDAAQLISRYRLERPLDPQDGINTRLMRKVDGRWVIALNHVSSKEPAR